MLIRKEFNQQIKLNITYTSKIKVREPVFRFETISFIWVQISQDMTYRVKCWINVFRATLQVECGQLVR